MSLNLPHSWREIAPLLVSGDPEKIARAIAFLDDRDRAMEDILAFTVREWTPVLDQGGTVTTTITQAQYILIGGLCIAWAIASITAAGTGGQTVRVTVPVPIHGDHGTSATIGSGIFVDASVPQRLVSAMIPGSTSTVRFEAHGAPGGIITGAVANGDAYRFLVIYRTI